MQAPPHIAAATRQGTAGSPPNNGWAAGTASRGSSRVEDGWSGPSPQPATTLFWATPHQTEAIIPEQARRIGRTSRCICLATALGTRHMNYPLRRAEQDEQHPMHFPSPPQSSKASPSLGQVLVWEALLQGKPAPPPGSSFCSHCYMPCCTHAGGPHLSRESLIILSVGWDSLEGANGLFLRWYVIPSEIEHLEELRDAQCIPTL